LIRFVRAPSVLALQIGSLRTALQMHFGDGNRFHKWKENYMPARNDPLVQLRKDVAAERVSHLEVIEMIDIAGKEYYKQNPLKKPSKGALWKRVLNELHWWGMKNGIEHRDLLVSRKSSTIVIRKTGTATIILRDKHGQHLLTYRWSSKKGLWTKDCKTGILPPRLRSQPALVAMALEAQHRRINAERQKTAGRRVKSLGKPR
jgi:hypothetical protein